MSGFPSGQWAGRTKPGVDSRVITAQQLNSFVEEGCLYALIDATDQRSVPPKMSTQGDGALSLFAGTVHHLYWAVAPYLTRVDAALLNWIQEELGDGPWGVFVVSEKVFDVVAAHCRDQLFTVLGDGQQWIFRYYDPRVLEREFAENALRDWDAFFGPLRAFVVTYGKDAGGLLYTLA